MEPQSELSKEFTADPALKVYYLSFGLLLVAVLVLPWFIPVLVFAPGEEVRYAIYSALAMVLIILLPLMIWIPLYYTRLVYGISEDEVLWSRGVLFRRTSIVPYTKITNVDIVQGPLMRAFGIYGLHVQTAGYSGQQSGRSEISIMGVKYHQRLRGLIMENVRKVKGGVLPPRPLATEELMLEELRKIRELLERGP
jgi:hypothetical protein